MGKINVIGIKRPIISVVVITYNHLKYIRQTLDSVLAQKVDVEFEIVIGDDHSTDGTTDIIAQYREKFPELIKPVLQEKNHGDGTNTRCAVTACLGEYIALCEGDDYWVDSGKLQKQYDFLKNNLSYSACTALADVLYEDSGTLKRHSPMKRRLSLTRKDFLLGIKPDTRTCTKMYRKSPFVESYFKYDLSSIYARDNISRIIITENHKKIMVLNETMAVYRVHSNGAWSMKSKDYQRDKKENDIECIRKLLPKREQKYLEFYTLVKKSEWEKNRLKKIMLYASLIRSPIILGYYLLKKSLVRWNYC